MIIKFFIILCMIFCHIVDDYYLQGILAQLKQKKWWEQNAPNKIYKYDYIIALIIHAFSWTYMIFLPIFIAYFLKINIFISGIFGLFVINLTIHAIVDDLKANELKINLIQDQLIHICQIIITGVLLIK